ncbi:hypothetical protein EJ419_03580 [Alloscardovia theropitheci]|uniref:Uncharacterized protein n=1 Tax=Alloscardovia theropitheci TaxID=2496842 RepID=A0A4R0QX68_9BIFI|nr:hypothetical protein [Alloscardovia theropitheci]TCD54140.1 hypothetical protein EJ419_03580 [Alloscardovia theropitheci]
MDIEPRSPVRDCADFEDLNFGDIDFEDFNFGDIDFEDFDSENLDIVGSSNDGADGADACAGDCEKLLIALTYFL